MREFHIWKTSGHHERAIRVSPIRVRRADAEIRREIIGVGQGRASLDVRRRLGGRPLQPMLRRLRDPAALEKAAVAVKRSGRDREC